MTDITTTTRNATLNDLAGLLKVQQNAKLDLVVPAQGITSHGANWHVAGTSLEGIGQPFRPTSIADGQIADKLGIPVRYLRRLREERPDLYDRNVNGLLHGDVDYEVMVKEATPRYAPDARSFLVRTFQSDEDGGLGIARALLSDRYGIYDHLDAVTAILDGCRDSGVNVDVETADLSETRMTLRLVCPEVSVLAPTLLKGYRPPVDHGAGYGRWQELFGRYGGDPRRPIVWAGIVATNCETGGGAFSLTPRIVVLSCTNGLTVTRDALRQVHLGAPLAEGRVVWSDSTQTKNLELIKAMTVDAVRTFTSSDYVEMVVDELEEKSGTPLANPAERLQVIGSQLRYSEETINGVLDHFIKGGQVTAGGVLQAVTSYAQTVADPDLSFDLETSAMEAFELAAAN